MTLDPLEPIVSAAGTSSESANRNPKVSRRLARPLDIERVWTPDHEAMVAALRVVLGLPRQLPDRGQRGVR